MMFRSSSFGSLTLAAALGALCAATARADTLIGQVVNASGVGVAGVTLAFSNGANPLNPISGANGLFAIAIPAGRYDIEFLPPAGSGLVPRQMLDVNIVGTANLGVVALATGFALTGRVIDANGLPIAGVDTQVVDAGTRAVLWTPGDNSNLNGDFVAIVPAGTYELQFRPLPTTLLVPRAIAGITVAGPVNVGATTLRSGVLATGTVTAAATGLPVVGVDIDVEDASSGETLLTPGDDTDALGNYAFVAPAGLYHLSYDPPTGSPLLGLERFNVDVQTGVSLGATPLQSGILLTGVVLGPGGAPVVGADIDVERTSGGGAVYTPHDDTDGTGRFAVMVPAGSYRVAIGPTFASGLVGTRTGPIQVAAPTTLPTTNLAAGHALTGTIRGYAGALEAGVDVDVIDPVSGAELVTESDDTDAAGRYRLIVPAGTFDLKFTPRKLSASRVLVVPGVNVAGPTTLDRQLQLVPVFAYLATIGVPTLGQGGPLPVLLAFMNPTPSTQATNASIAFIAPDGTETLLLPPTAIPMPSGSGGAAFLLLALPTVPPAQLGLPCRLELRFDDPTSGAEQDHDSIRFVIR